MAQGKNKGKGHGKGKNKENVVVKEKILQNMITRDQRTRRTRPDKEPCSGSKRTQAEKGGGCRCLWACRKDN